MKKFLTFIICILSALTLFAQSVEIKCAEPNCFNSDPAPETANYEAKLTGEPIGYVRTIEWEATPTNSFCCEVGASNLFFSLAWDNDPNFPSKKVKVKVRYVSGTDTIRISDERTVIIKHIGPITSINIPGASPTNPANGGTTSVPCGVNNLTITVPTPVTDPVNSVVYAWTLPNGWTGSSTSNSISVTTNTGAIDGTLSVVARRTDGVVTRSYSVNITRPRVQNASISSLSWTPDDKPLCTGESRQLSGTGSVNATTYSWTPTGGISIASGGNQSIVTINGTANGTLTLLASNACEVSKTKTVSLFAGSPQISSSDVLVDGHPNYYPNYTTGSSYISIQGGSNCQTYKWELFGGSGYFYPGYCGCGNTFNGINFNDCNSGNASTSSSMAIRIRSANRCGQGNDVIIPLELSGGYYRMTSPNPTTTVVSLEISKEKVNALNSVNLVNVGNSKMAKSFDIGHAKKSEYFKNSNVISFDVSNLERGMYYLILGFGEQNTSFEELIMLK